MTAKKHVVTWDMLQVHVRELVKRLLPISRWNGILAVSRGGLVPASIVARELSIRYVDTICISSYEKNCQKEMQILKRAPGNGDGFIVVDDVVDTGGTAQVIRTMYPKAYFVSIFAKPSGSSLVDNYVVDISQDVWIELPWDMGICYQKPLMEH